MWCVTELNEDYIAKMEDVPETRLGALRLLETYEQPYDPKEPVVCLDEKPVTPYADVRPLLRPRPDGKRDGIRNTSVAGRPMFSVR